MNRPTSTGPDHYRPSSTAPLAAVLEALPVAIWSVDAVEGEGLDLATGFYSRAVQHLTGLPPEKLVQPGNFLPLVHPEDRPRFLAGWRTVFEDHGEVAITYRVRNQETGEWLNVLEQARAMPTAKPGRFHLVGVMHDVTEREETRNALRESEERMRVLVEGTPYLFFYTQDVDGLVTYVSPSVEAITGRSVTEWLGQSHWFTPDTERNIAARRATDIHLRGGPNQGPSLVDVKHADGRDIVLEVFEQAVVRNRQVMGLQGVARDVTDHRRLEESLAQSQRSEAEGRIAADVVHDVDSKLQAIVSAAELASKGPGGDVDARLTEILRLARESRDLVRRLLAD